MIGGGGAARRGTRRARRAAQRLTRRSCLLALLAAVGAATGCGDGDRGSAPDPSAFHPQDAETAARAAAPAGQGSPASTIGMTMSREELLGKVERELKAQLSGGVPDFLALERQPGVTPALPQVATPAGPRHPDLAGAPGPSPAMGPLAAPVKVFVFSDFQCPVCRRIVEPLKHLARAHVDDVQIVFKHNALPTHAYARRAAGASIAAFRQGKFWEYHDLVFQNQGALGEADLLRYAEMLGLDLTRFRADMDAPEVETQLDYEAAMANRLGAPGTPGFFVNGRPLLGWGSYSGMKAMVDQALADARPVGARGVEPARVAVAATAAAGPEGALLADLMWGVKN